LVAKRADLLTSSEELSVPFTLFDTKLMRLMAITAVLATAPFLAACEEIVDFSGQPREEVATISPRVEQTPIYVAERVDLAGLEVELTGRIPQVIAEISDRIRKAVCTTIDGDKVCRDAIVSGSVERDGEPSLVGTTTGFELQVPVKIALRARRVGQKNDEAVTITARKTIKAGIIGKLDESWTASVSFAGQFTWNETPTVQVFDSTYSIGGDVERALRRRVDVLTAVLTDKVQPKQLKTMTAATWRALQSPVQIGERPDIWLIGEPLDVRFGGFAVRPDSRTLEIRTAIVTQLKTSLGSRPTPLWPRDMVQLSVAPASATGGVVLPVEVSYDDIAASLDRSALKGAVKTGETIGYAIKGMRIQPAGIRLALSVDLALDVSASMRTLRGYAYYLATPEVREGDTMLRLTKAVLYEPAAIPDTYRDRLQPFLEKAMAERIGLATAYDLGPAMQQAMALVNTAADRRLAEGLRLSGKLKGWKVRSAEPGRNALRLNVEFTGELTVTDDRAAVAAGVTTQPEPGLPPQ
jgi:Domain of unknown function (DUF4403)